MTKQKKTPDPNTIYTGEGILGLYSWQLRCNNHSYSSLLMIHNNVLSVSQSFLAQAKMEGLNLHRFP